MNSVPPGSDVSTLEIKSQGLGACLAGNFLRIPRYQRAFSWDDENVSDFLADVNTAFANKAPEYFMGSVVLQGSSQSYEVVDGQQRLTTATILVAAARDFLASKGMMDVAKSLESQFLITKDIWSQEIKPRLSLSVYDNDYFLRSILQGEAMPAARESHERLLAAKGKASQFIEGIHTHFSDWFDRLGGVIQYLEHKARVIQVIVPSQSNAYVIFETLNDRGKDLSASDLLKNHLFGRADNRIDEVQAKWNQMLGILEPQGGDDLVITYIRQLWSATREVAREKELFAKIRDKIVSPQQAVDFSHELLNRATHYAALLNSAHPLWKEIGGESAAVVASFNALKIERYRPALLALLSTFSGNELIHAMKIILAGSVRYLIAIGAGGGTLEAAWSDVARKVSAKEISKASAFAKEIQKIVPNDEVFKSAFRTARISKSFLARYFLQSLERFARGEANCELVPNTEVAFVNLEHVLPENPENNWKTIPPEVAEAYARRLGNQVLLSSKKNSELGNLAFEEKRATLAASEFILTKQVGESPTWGPAEIDARQEALAEMAVSVWPYKF
jgi:hypothetical protein